MTSFEHELLIAADAVAGLQAQIRTLQEKSMPASQAQLAVADAQIDALEAEVARLSEELAATRAGHAEELATIIGSKSWRIGNGVVSALNRLRGRGR